MVGVCANYVVLHINSSHCCLCFSAGPGLQKCQTRTRSLTVSTWAAGQKVKSLVSGLGCLPAAMG